MFWKYLPQILTYFKHLITNAVSEWFNSKIQTIKKMAYSFRNCEDFKIAINFHCVALDLYPVTHIKCLKNRFLNFPFYASLRKDDLLLKN